MDMNDLRGAQGAASPEVFQQLGLITRQLHDALNQLGVMPTLRQSADSLPDARSRLAYIARKTGEAADKVLNAVDLAKKERDGITLAAKRLAAYLAEECSRAPASADDGVRANALALVGEIQASTTRIDDHLTDIMLAQDFHDLTGQVVAKVVTLATDLEDGLVKLLVQAAPLEAVVAVEPCALAGPVIDTEGNADVVSSQGEVDDLLASLGF